LPGKPWWVVAHAENTIKNEKTLRTFNIFFISLTPFRWRITVFNTG
jgi:hypothetical protein